MEEKMDDEELAAKIEHTLLKQDATVEQIKKLCIEAKENNFFGVCVSPYFVKDAVKFLQKSKQKVITVIGFPLGYSATISKVEEAKRAIMEGATELDMVMNLSAFRDKQWKFIINDLESVRVVAQLHNSKLKVIIETCLLSGDEIRKACELCAEVGVDFVKTSSGFSTGGVTVEAVRIMRESLPKKIKIKAAGGIKSREFAEELIAAGADRIGSSASLSFMTEK